jgi:hypothetical protein
MVMNEDFLFVKIDTRWLHADKSISEDRQKLVQFCPTVYILYAPLQKYREKRTFFVCHVLFCLCFNSYVLSASSFFLNACRLVAKTLLVSKQRTFVSETQVRIVTAKEQD